MTTLSVFPRARVALARPLCSFKSQHIFYLEIRNLYSVYTTKDPLHLTSTSIPLLSNRKDQECIYFSECLVCSGSAVPARTVPSLRTPQGPPSSHGIPPVPSHASRFNSQSPAAKGCPVYVHRSVPSASKFVLSHHPGRPAQGPRLLSTRTQSQMHCLALPRGNRRQSSHPSCTVPPAFPVTAPKNPRRPCLAP